MLRALVLGTIIGTAVATTPLAEDGFPIGGSTPDRRPEGAPTITEVVKGPEWYAHALRGVSEPIPSSLGFLEDEGNWYTPFNRPGMPPPYDPRGLHQVGS